MQEVVFHCGSDGNHTAQPLPHCQHVGRAAQGEQQIRDAHRRYFDDGEFTANLALQILGKEHQYTVRTGRAGQRGRTRGQIPLA